MQKQNTVIAGVAPEKAEKVLIMIHGRGASPESILSLSPYLKIKGFAVIAPRASNGSWYPFPFIAPRQQNEPSLSDSLKILDEIVNDLTQSGKTAEQLFFLGFSQGSCLMLDYIARHPMSYGGAVAFSGGLVGEALNPDDYTGDLNGMPVFLGSSDPDSHIPVPRVNETEAILQSMNASVTKRIYKNMGHTISQEEIDLANDLVLTHNR